MKKTITMILAVVLLVSALSITASAASKYTSGRYRGKSWSGSVSAFPNSASAEITYSGIEELKITLYCFTYAYVDGSYEYSATIRRSGGAIQQNSVIISRPSSETVASATGIYYVDGARVSECSIER